MAPSTVADLQRRFYDLLDHLPAGVVVHGVDGRILHANGLACELIGRSLEQLRGTESNRQAWNLLSPDGGPMPPERFPVNVVRHTGRQLSQQVIGVEDLKSGRVRWVICNAYPNSMSAACCAGSWCASPTAPP